MKASSISGPRPHRRAVLRGALGVGLAAPVASFGIIRPALAQWAKYPFSLGVASGDPAPDGFVLWTRLAPDPLLGRGGMRPAPVKVTFEVAADEAMTRVLRTGEAVARIETGHCVHIEVEGLEPARAYFYRFRAGDAQSAVGRVRTLPPAGAPVAQIRFASAGCQLWENGFYTAWRRIAEENLDFVCHYGDYIYEGGRSTQDQQRRPWTRVLPEGFPNCINLVDYRRRYGLYKSDPDLQAAHASCAFLPSFDDHEISDNWANDTERDTPPEAFLFRRAAALQAWWEHMPVRRAMLPRGPDILAYRAFDIGALATIAVLDTRQYRSKQACGDGGKAGCAEADDPRRTMTGAAQEEWLARVLRDSKTPWQVLAQQVTFSRFDWQDFPFVKAKEPDVHNMDAWDGAKAAQARVLKMARAAPNPNPVVLSGDIHHGVALEMREDWTNVSTPCVGVEFVATSITSGGDGEAPMAIEGAVLSHNPHVKHISNRRGYVRHTVTPKTWTADYRALEKVSEPGAPATTLKSFVVEAGKPGLNDG